jgi:hypothetical protein
MKHLQKPDWNWDPLPLPEFSYHGYWNCMFAEFLTRYTCPPIVFTIKCRVVTNIWRYNPISSKHVSLMFALWSSPHHIPIRSRGLIKKSTHLRPIYLNFLHCNFMCLCITYLYGHDVVAYLFFLCKSERRGVTPLSVNEPYEIKEYFQGEYEVMHILMGHSTYLHNIITICAHSCLTIRIWTSDKIQRVCFWFSTYSLGLH